LRITGYLLLIAVGALLVYAATGLPNRGDPNAPSHRRESIAGTEGASAYYIQHALEEAATPNIVTVILADYRGYDTLGETTVIFTAGLICFLLLRRKRP
jgi:multicomponent Na+:H+ antiporter subunit B